MKDHAYFEELISRMLDDELTADETRELDEHIAACPECRLTAEAFRAVHTALSEELSDAPADLHEYIMADIRRSEVRKKNRRHRPIVAAAACIAAVFIGMFAFRGGKMGVQAAAGAIESFSADTEVFDAVTSAASDAGYFSVDEIPAASMARELPAAEFFAEAEEDAPKECGAPARMLGLASDTVYFLHDAEDMEVLRQLLSDEKTEEMPENAALFSVVCEADGSVICVFEQPDGTLLYTDDTREGCFAGACTVEDCRKFVMENEEK